LEKTSSKSTEELSELKEVSPIYGMTIQEETTVISEFGHLFHKFPCMG
jgi:hypothetical protein